LSTKIHAAGDALGNPVRLIGSPGQRNDIAFAQELIDGFAADVTIADKGYDADHLCDRIASTGSPAPEAKSSSRQSATGPSNAPMTPTSTKSAISSSASSTSSNSSAASPPDMTSCSPTSWASSNSPLSQSGSNS
jgi:hypothetical protein